MDASDPVNGLIKMTSTLDFLDDENSLPETPDKIPHFPIIAKILSDKTLNNNAIKSTLLKAWGISPKTPANVIEQNTIVFLLEREIDCRGIERQSPWSFRGNLIVTRPWLPEEALDEVDLSKFQIWVQAYGLPVMYVNKKLAEKIGNAIGSFIEADLATESHR
ncbi:hypothetical protein Salat_0208500 [Sesamum alatum]|uniref:DUF4283 domain-containing protein n=1 Tax=Sesamum alatum TaxID=300844 RepID=A0AAE2CYH2_9LAMI|nr:hypothetical protein Salat_0208500 [Sesamum alatum]